MTLMALMLVLILIGNTPVLFIDRRSLAAASRAVEFTSGKTTDNDGGDGDVSQAQ